MPVTLRRIILPVAMVALVGHYCPATSQTPQKNWKDRPEYDLYESITRESAPAKKLELLNTWNERYPASDFADVRQQEYLTVYSQLGQSADVLTVASDMLAKNPNHIQALSSALAAVFSIPSPSSDQLATGERAAHQVLSKLDTLFAAGNKPPKATDADWETAKRNIQQYAQNVLGYVGWQRKDYDAAEAGFLKSLQADPSQAQVSYWLASVILAERKPEKYSAAIYYMARAAAYDGPGSLNEAGREKVMESFQKTYSTYHGSSEGAAQVLEQAKMSPMPPSNYKIPSKADVLKAQSEREEQLKKTNPQLALWKSIKEALTGPEAQSYFDEHMKDAELPEFRGTLIQATPETRPKQLTLAIEDGTTPDATLILKEPLPGKMEPGAELRFKGVPKSYTVIPFGVTLAVEKSKLVGWKGIAAPAKAQKKSTPVHKNKR